MATLAQLQDAFLKADAAGNTEDAQAFADAIAAMQPQSPTANPSVHNGDPAPKAAAPQAYWTQRLGEARSAGEGLRYSVADTAMGLGQMIGSGLDATLGGHRRSELDANAARLRANKTAEAAKNPAFFSGGNMVGDIAQAALPMSKVSALSKVGLLANTAAGAAYGATRPTVGDESRGLNTAIGGVSSLGGQLFGDALALAGRQAPKAAQAAYQAAKARGIDLTPAQLSDSEFVKRLSLMTDRLPFSGAAKRTQRQNESVNKSLAGLIGEHSDVVDSNVMGQAYDRMGKQFDNIFAGGARYDRGFLKDIAGVKREAADQLDDTANRFADSFAARVKKQGKDGVLSGRALQSLDQQARKAATGNGDRQQVALAMREALHDNFGRTAGADKKAAWDTVRKQYATYKTIEPLVARNPEGPISPAQLLGAINSNGRGRAAMARGSAGDLGDLAAIGQRMKGPKTSGTAENTQTAATSAGLLTNTAATLGLLGLGNITGRALNSKILSGLLMNANRGRYLTPAAAYARPFPLLLSRSAYANGPEGP